jgi:hypothetical protein
MGQTSNSKAQKARKASFPPGYMYPAVPGMGIQDLNVVPTSAADFFVATLGLRWTKLPRAKDREPFTGLSRSVINTLILPSPENGFKARVESASFRQPGQKKATRLVRLKSLLAFVEDQAQKTAAADAALAKRKRGSKRQGRLKRTKDQEKCSNPREKRRNKPS